MTMGDRIRKWKQSPALLEMRVKIKQKLANPISSVIIYLEHDLFDELIAEIPPQERWAVLTQNDTHFIYLGWVLEPY